MRDMGPRPSPDHEIERSDNERGYCKDNCCWATRKQQMRNTRRTHWLSHDGTTLCLEDWAKRVGLNRNTLVKRLRSGWSVARAIEPPVKA